MMDTVVTLCGNYFSVLAVPFALTADVPRKKTHGNELRGAFYHCWSQVNLPHNWQQLEACRSSPSLVHTSGRCQMQTHQCTGTIVRRDAVAVCSAHQTARYALMKPLCCTVCVHVVPVAFVYKQQMQNEWGCGDNNLVSNYDKADDCLWHPAKLLFFLCERICSGFEVLQKKLCTFRKQNCWSWFAPNKQGACDDAFGSIAKYHMSSVARRQDTMWLHTDGCFWMLRSVQFVFQYTCSECLPLTEFENFIDLSCTK